MVIEGPQHRATNGTGAMLKQIGIATFGLVIIGSSSSAFAQQVSRPLTRSIIVQAQPVAAKPATRAISVEAAPAAEITAEAPAVPEVAPIETAAPIVAAPAPAPVVVEKAPVLVKEERFVKIKPVERYAGYGYGGSSSRYSGGYAHNCH